MGFWERNEGGWWWWWWSEAAVTLEPLRKFSYYIHFFLCIAGGGQWGLKKVTCGHVCVRIDPSIYTYTRGASVCSVIHLVCLYLATLREEEGEEEGKKKMKRRQIKRERKMEYVHSPEFPQKQMIGSRTFVSRSKERRDIQSKIGSFLTIHRKERKKGKKKCYLIFLFFSLLFLQCRSFYG